MEKSSFHKEPASAMSKPSKRQPPANSAQAEDAREEKELQAAQGQIAARRKAQHDPIADLLGATYFVTDWAWPFLRWGPGALTVSRWYPEINVAIDTFNYVGDHEKRLIEHKRKTLNENHIKYAWLDWSKKTSDLVPELEAQK